MTGKYSGKKRQICDPFENGRQVCYLSLRARTSSGGFVGAKFLLCELNDNHHGQALTNQLFALKWETNDCPSWPNHPLRPPHHVDFSFFFAATIITTPLEGFVTLTQTYVVSVLLQFNLWHELCQVTVAINPSQRHRDPHKPRTTREQDTF